MSITLTTAKTVSINGSQVESDTQAAATLLDYDFLANVATLRFNIGSGAPSAFNIGVYDTPATLTVNMTTGTWSTTSGQSGTFSGAGFTSFQNQFKAIRNAAETFAAAQITPVLGTQVAWT
jgi:hypothetical protein